MAAVVVVVVVVAVEGIMCVEVRRVFDLKLVEDEVDKNKYFYFLVAPQFTGGASTSRVCCVITPESAPAPDEATNERKLNAEIKREKEKRKGERASVGIKVW